MAVLRVYNAYNPFSGFCSFWLHEVPHTNCVLRASSLTLMECMLLAVFLATPRLDNKVQRSMGHGTWATH